MEEEAKIGGREGLLTGIDLCSRDFLRRFDRNGFASDLPEDVRDTSHDLELRLSLAGCFSGGSSGWTDQQEKKIFRSSSIASFSSPALADLEFPAVAPSLTRTSSLPAEHEERRKRKEMQALRRLEAKRKRKRKEKMNSMKTDQKSDEAVETSKASTARADRPADLPVSSSSASAISFRNWRTQGIWDGRYGQISGKDGENTLEEEELKEKEENHPKTSEMMDDAEDPTRRNNKMIEEMPCVSTRGDGPDGRRIEGFLYKYKKGEEVRIVCVCHGNFLTPAEFVKHAGGGDGAVAHPLRHIVVSPTSFNCL